jgi:aminomethyltransferase
VRNAIGGTETTHARAVMAVQGPQAREALSTFWPAAAGVGRFRVQRLQWQGVPVTVAGTGYTGEDGVELLAMAEDAPALWDAILARGVVPCGLGARDVLRLEVCYPLHGNDISPETDAISAGLGWVCALDKEFTGAGRLRAVKETGPQRKLVAFAMEEKAIPRAGMAIAEGGVVTSGTHSPSLDRGIGMAYVPAALAAPGTELTVDVRGNPRRARVEKKPLYKKES